MIDEYYRVDMQCGSIVTVNGKNVYNLYNADLKSIKFNSGTISSDFSKSVGGSGLFVNNHDIGIGGFTAIFYVGGLYKEDSEINVSNLIAECSRCVFRTDEDSFEYDSVLESFSCEDTGVYNFKKVELKFRAIKRLPMVTKEFNSSPANFNNQGSIKSGAILRIKHSGNVQSAIVDGITVSNLSGNLDFVIDGISGEVKCNGINRFLDTDLIEFPKVSPGNNSITFSNGVTLEVSFYPTFVI